MSGQRSGRPRRVAAVTAVLAAAGAVVAVVLFVLSGGSWYVVETPSMGQAAPVGTLVVTAPVRESAVAVGDVVTYAPPSGGLTVTHRVVEVDPAGFRTRGDVNGGDDPWLLTGAELRGRAIALVPGIGWLLRALPLLLGGAALVLALTALVRDPAVRLALRLVGGSAVVSAVVLLLRPLVDAEVLSVLVGEAGTDVRVVGTGLLPVDVASGSRSMELVTGRAGILHLPAGTAGRIDLSIGPHLEPWGWALFAVACGVPLVVAVLRSRTT